MNLELDFEGYDSGFCWLHIFVQVIQNVWFFCKSLLQIPVTSKKYLNFVEMTYLINGHPTFTMT